MSENGILAKLMKILRKDNNLSLAIIGVAAIGLIIYILTTMSGPSESSQDQTSANDGGAALQADESATELETRLARILSRIENAGDVEVMVTYASGPEIVPAVKTDTQQSTSEGAGDSGSTTTSTNESNEPVVIQGKNGTEALVLVERVPEVLGVLVVAEGASDLGVRLKLMQAVQVALQITPDRIEVLPMNTSNNREGN